MPEWIVTLLPQLGLVILFMWYQERAEERRNQAAREVEEKRIEAAKQNHAEWRVFLREREEAYGVGLGRIAEEVKLLSQNVAGVNAVLIAHDTRAIDATGDIRRIRERLMRAGIGNNVEDSPIPEGK